MFSQVVGEVSSYVGSGVGEAVGFMDVGFAVGLAVGFLVVGLVLEVGCLEVGLDEDVFNVGFLVVGLDVGLDAVGVRTPPPQAQHASLAAIPA